MLLHVQHQEVRAVRLAAAAIVLLLGACGAPPAPHEAWQPGYVEQQGPPNWAAERPGLKNDIDAAIDAHDCGRLDQLFVEAVSSPQDNPAVLTHIDRWGNHLGCPQFADTEQPE